MGKEEQEEICVQRFLNWYNERYRRNYIRQRAEKCFPDLKGGLRWEFVAYECDNRGEWMGIEVKELATVRETHIQFEFWRKLCLELTQDLEGRGIQGEFGILPPSFRLIHKDRPKFREAFIEVLIDKESILKADEFTDIGPDIADKFTNWPTEKSDVDEWGRWGTHRPSKLMISKSSDAGCKVHLSMMTTGAYSVPEKSKEAFDEVFKPRNGRIQANEQLKLAKEKGARETILLLCCYPFIYEDLIENELQNLDRHLISGIDHVYLVNLGSKGKIVKIYPS